MLTLQLRELEVAGVVQREVYREVPPKVQYALTPFGRMLEPLILLLRDWAQESMQSIVECKQAERRARNQRDLVRDGA